MKFYQELIFVLATKNNPEDFLLEIKTEILLKTNFVLGPEESPEIEILRVLVQTENGTKKIWEPANNLVNNLAEKWLEKNYQEILAEM